MLCVSVALGNENIWEIFAHSPWMGRLWKLLIWSLLKWKVSYYNPVHIFIWALTSFKLNVMDRPTVHWLSLVALVLIIFWSLSFDPCPNHPICPSCQIVVLIWTQWRQHLSSSPFLWRVLVLIIPLLCPCHNCLSVSCVLLIIIVPSLVAFVLIPALSLCPCHRHPSCPCQIIRPR